MNLLGFLLAAMWLDKTWKLHHIEVQMQVLANIRLVKFNELDKISYRLPPVYSSDQFREGHGKMIASTVYFIIDY